MGDDVIKSGLLKLIGQFCCDFIGCKTCVKLLYRGIYWLVSFAVMLLAVRFVKSFCTMSNLLYKVKSAYEPQVAHQAGAYLSFRTMKRLGVLLLPPGWDASPSQGYPQQ